MWAYHLHGRDQRWSGRIGDSTPPASTPNRSGRQPARRPGSRRLRARAPHPPARSARKRPNHRVRPQRPHYPVEQRLRHPARTSRVVRRTRPLVMPYRRLPDLRDDAHRREGRLHARTRSSPLPTEACSSAVRSLVTTSCSICDRRHGCPRCHKHHVTSVTSVKPRPGAWQYESHLAPFDNVVVSSSSGAFNAGLCICAAQQE